MANTNAPLGLKALRLAGGGAVPPMEEMRIATTNTTAIFFGDIVKVVADGTIEDSDAGDTLNVGVFQGCRYVNSAGEQKFSRYWTGEASATDIVAYVHRDPKIIYEAQADTFALTAEGAHADHVAGSGSTTTGNSAMYIEGSSLGTDKGFKILRLVPRADNAVGAYAKVEVMFAEHVDMAITTGVNA